MSEQPVPSPDRTGAEPEALVVPESFAGERLDRTLVALDGTLSRGRVQALIKAGHVSSDGQPVREPAARVRAGSILAYVRPPPEPATPAPEVIALDVVYEDADLIVIDKPAGLVVHPAAGHRTGTLVNALLAHCGASLSGIGGVARPGIVHRLDKDTSGLLVVAKTDAAHTGLAHQFASHGIDGQLERVYSAVVWGALPRSRLTVDAALARAATDRKRIAVSKAATARRAVTHVEVAEAFVGPDGRVVASLLDARLETGRTHQIRVHMAHIGHPVLGDASYGKGHRTMAVRLAVAAQAALADLGRQALHARVLGFQHPCSGRRLRFERPPPADLSRLIDALRIKT